VSISPTFYERHFHAKVLCAAFLYLQFGFVIFWQKNISAKTAPKMLMKLTTGLFTHTTSEMNSGASIQQNSK